MTTVAPAPDTLPDRLLDERIVLLAGEIDDAGAARAVAALLLLAARDPHRDIDLYLSSPGGSVTAATAVHDALRHVGPDVATWAVGLVAGTAATLLAAGASGKRHALPHARILMHRPAPGGTGPAGDVAGRAGVLADLWRGLAEHTAARAGRPVAEILADAEAQRRFTAEQARAYGLVDHVGPGRGGAPVLGFRARG